VRNRWQECLRYEGCVKRHYQLNVRQTVISGLYYMGICTFLINCCVQVATGRRGYLRLETPVGLLQCVDPTAPVTWLPSMPRPQWVPRTIHRHDLSLSGCRGCAQRSAPPNPLELLVGLLQSRRSAASRWPRQQGVREIVV
jgi:hypothetical protein